MARVISTDEYNLIIDTIRDGFTHNGVEYKPNDRIATILVLQANLGLRVGDTVNMKLDNIKKHSDGYKLDICEEKTSKHRTFTVPMEIYNFILNYCIENSIGKTLRIFPITVRAVQKHLKSVSDYLGLEDIGSHSFRKYFATEIYKDSNYNMALVQKLLQHSDMRTTQRYIDMDNGEVERALTNHIRLR